MKEIVGSCHCGNIRFSLHWPEWNPPITVRACQCTFCRKHGGVYTSNPSGRLQINIADSSRVTPYAFGTRTAEFHTCQVCGAVPVVTSEIDGVLHAVVNVNTFENVDKTDLNASPSDFDAEDLGGRLERRKRNWIADVSVVRQG